MIRSFAALRLAKEARDELALCASGLKSLDKKEEIRWMPSDNYHLTLCFFGDIEPERIDLLKSDLAGRLAKFPAANVAISDISFFPFSPNPRVVAGIVRATDRLKSLKTAVDQAARNRGIPLEKKGFKPHVTLGRIRGRFRPKMKIVPRALALNCQVTKLTLFQSVLSPKGATYLPLCDIPLSGT